jgi:hypothetical protein
MRVFYEARPQSLMGSFDRFIGRRFLMNGLLNFLNAAHYSKYRRLSQFRAKTGVLSANHESEDKDIDDQDKCRQTAVDNPILQTGPSCCCCIRRCA